MAEPGETKKRLRGGRQGHGGIRQLALMYKKYLLPAGEAAQPAQVSQLCGQVFKAD